MDVVTNAEVLRMPGTRQTANDTVVCPLVGGGMFFCLSEEHVPARIGISDSFNLVEMFS